MEENKCGHISKKGKVCGKDKGHEGVHQSWEDVSKPQKTGDMPETAFIINEWDDEGKCVHSPAFQEQGEAFLCDYALGTEARQAAMNLAIADAKKELAAGSVFEIRAKCTPSEEAVFTPFTRRKEGYPVRDQEKDWGVAWYRVPPQPGEYHHLATPTEPLFENGVDNGFYNEMLGCTIIARIRA